MSSQLQTARALVEDARRDLQFAFRSLRREPGVAAGIVATFALAIGANAAIVGLVARLMLSAPPGVRDPASLARLHVAATSIDGERYVMTSMSYPAFQQTRALGRAFVGVAASRSVRLTSGSGADMAEISVVAATGEYFRVLGVRPALGRFFGPDDDALPTGNAVAWRLGATLFSALGSLALAIAALGLFAVVSYLVTQRVREIGIRLALGGSGASIAGLVVGGALRLVGVGAMIGAVGAVVLTPFVQSMLFETSMRDMSVVLSIAGVFSAVAVAAATLPALRAARVSPSSTLQAE